MAIIQENIGNDLVKTYSSLKVKIHGGFPEGDYDEAIDPISAGRTYTETDIPIDEEDDGESEIEAKAAAYDILMGDPSDE